MSPTKLWLYKLLTNWLPESRCYNFKNALLRWAGAKIGQNVRIYSSAVILGNGSLEIGDDVHIGSGVFISSSAPAGIVIGSHIDIGPQVVILTGSHQIDPQGEHIGGEGIVKSISIGDGSWLGARSLILPGVSLSVKSLVAAGAVVTHSPETSCCLIAGVPAQVKKQY